MSRDNSYLHQDLLRLIQHQAHQHQAHQLQAHQHQAHQHQGLLDQFHILLLLNKDKVFHGFVVHNYSGLYFFS